MIFRNGSIVQEGSRRNPEDCQSLLTYELPPLPPYHVEWRKTVSTNRAPQPRIKNQTFIKSAHVQNNTISNDTNMITIKKIKEQEKERCMITLCDKERPENPRGLFITGLSYSEAQLSSGISHILSKTGRGIGMPRKISVPMP